MTIRRAESRTPVPPVFLDALKSSQPEWPPEWGKTVATPAGNVAATSYAVAGSATVILGSGLAFVLQDETAELMAKVSTLERQNTQLRRGFNALARRVAVLEQEVEMLKAEGEIIEIRDIPRKQAKDEIRRLFATGETLYYSDIVQRLQIGIELVVELCKELEVEDEIQVNGNAN